MALHVFLATFFEFQILWNYFSTSLRSPGRPPLGVPYGSAELAANGRLGGFELCRRCDTPRPLRSHHCTACGRCTYDLDHHCIYVNNCVGHHNRRSFVLFCAYAVGGCAYPMCLVLRTLWFDVDAIFHLAFQRCAPRRVLVLFLAAYGRLPVGPDGVGSMRDGPIHRCISLDGLAFFTFLVCDLMVVILVTGLLLQQIMFLAQRCTMLEMMKGQRQPIYCNTRYDGMIKAMENIKEVLGPPGWWLWPRHGPVPPDVGGRPMPPEVQPVALAGGGGGGAEGEEGEEKKTQ